MFDIIWAEGSINHVGFKRGPTEWGRFLKPKGCLAVHDGKDNLAQKLDDIPALAAGYFNLDEQTWKRKGTPSDAKADQRDDHMWVIGACCPCWIRSNRKSMCSRSIQRAAVLSSSS